MTAAEFSGPKKHSMGMHGSLPSVPGARFQGDRVLSSQPGSAQRDHRWQMAPAAMLWGLFLRPGGGSGFDNSQGRKQGMHFLGSREALANE